MKPSITIQKVGTLVVGTSAQTGEKVIFVGKNFHSQIKFEKLKNNTTDTTSIKKFPSILNLPGGKVDGNENLKIAMLRELTEESGGFFTTKSLLPESPWQKTKQNFLDKICLFKEEDLTSINEEPVAIEMFSIWQDQIVNTEYFFYELNVGTINIDDISEFCHTACNLLDEKEYSSYQEVDEYFEIPVNQFLEKLNEMAKIIEVDQAWLWGPSDKDDLEKIVTFTNLKNQSLSFNKGYFFALSRIFDKIKKSLLN